MELQLSTQKAQQALKQIETSLSTLQSAFSNFGKGAGNFDAILRPLNNFKGPTPQAAASVKQLSDALTQLSRVGDFSKVNQSLQQLSRVNVGQLAKNVQALSQALAQIRVPPGLQQAAQALNNIGTAAQRAQGPVRQLASSMGQIRVPTGLTQTANGFGQVSQQARQASQAVSQFSQSARGAQGVLAGFGIALSAVGAKQWISSSVDMVRTMDQFQVQIKAVTGSTEAAAKEYAYLNEVTRRMVLPIREAAGAYGKLAMAVNASGRDISEARQLFEGFATTFRVLGLTQAQMARGFRAVEQIVGKGAVNMEELRQQLGELFPAFTLLAESMGISTMELAKLMEQGKVSSSVLFRFADDLKEKYGGSLEEALKKPAVALDMLANSIEFVRLAFGRGFLEAAAPGIRKLAEALDSDGFKKSIENIGRVAGMITGALAEAITWMINNVPYAAEAIAGFGAAFATLKIGAFVGLLARLAFGFTGVGKAISLVALAVPAVAGVFYVLYNAFNAVGEGVSWVASTIADGFSLLWSDLQMLGQGIVNLGQWFWNLGATIVNSVVSAFSTVGSWIGNLISWFWDLGSTIVNYVIGAFSQLGSGISAVASWFWNLGSAIYESVSYAFDYVAQAIDTVINWFSGLGNVLSAVIGWFQSFAQSVVGYINVAFEAVGKFVDAVGKWFSWLGEIISGFVGYLGELAVKLGLVSGEAANAAVKSEQLANTTQAAANAAGQASSAASSASSSVASFGNSASAATSKVNGLAQATNNLAAANRNLAASSGGGGGTAYYDGAGNLYDQGGNWLQTWYPNKWNTPGYSGGGIAGKRTGHSVRVDPRAFIGAPHFATGGTTSGMAPTLPGGGIPAVLHDNEAVVPLTGGGAIPVQSVGNPAAQSGGGGINVAHMMKVASDTLYALRSINLEVVRLKEAVHSQSVLLIDWLDKLNQNLTKISQNTMGGGTGGGRVSGGGGSLSGGGSFGGGDDPIAALRNQVANMRAEKQTDLLSHTKGKVSKPGAIAQYWDGAYYSMKSSPFNQWEKEWDNKFSTVYRNFVAEYGAEALISAIPLTDQAREHYRAYEKMLKTGEPTKKTSMIGFATGSPNAWKDVQGGGFQATLHPDEAVIPLPDGRSVPVKMPDSIFDKMDALSAQFAQRIYDVETTREDAFIDRAASLERDISRGRPKTSLRDRSDKPSGPSTVVVHMNIQTPDAASFRASQNQIMQEFKSKLERSAKTLGNVQFVDDPTRPVGRE